MRRLIEGHLRFQHDVFPARRDFFERLSGGQAPRALFIACADSRVDPVLTTQADPGEIFVCRNVGNIVPSHGEFTGGVSSAIEYAVMALKVKHVVVFGHTDCGAMKALLHPEALKGMPGVANWLKHAESARFLVHDNHPELAGEAQLRSITEENVVAQLRHLETHPSVASRLRKGELEVHGWIYDIRRGAIDAWSTEAERFAPLSDWAAAHTPPLESTGSATA